MKCPNWFSEEQCKLYKSSYSVMDSFLRGHTTAIDIGDMPNESHLALAWASGLRDAAVDYEMEMTNDA